MSPKVKWLQKANHVARPLLTIFLFPLPRVKTKENKEWGIYWFLKVTYPIHMQLTLCRDSIRFLVHKTKIHIYTSLVL